MLTAKKHAFTPQLGREGTTSRQSVYVCMYMYRGMEIVQTLFRRRGNILAASHSRTGFQPGWWSRMRECDVPLLYQVSVLVGLGLLGPVFWHLNLAGLAFVGEEATADTQQLEGTSGYPSVGRGGSIPN